MRADDLDDVRAQLAAQQALNDRLLERLDDVEATLESRQLSPGGDSSVATGHRGADFALLREELDSLQSVSERLPQIGGYFDLEFFNDNRSDSASRFRQHHLTLFISKQIERFRLFSELEWEDGSQFKGSGGTALSEARGEIKMEQGWAEFAFSDLLTLRGGLILTPGYWNVNHWPTLVASTRRPLMVRKIYPMNFTGLMAHGDKYWGRAGNGISYWAYLGNGDSPNMVGADDNENKAGGGRVSWHVPNDGWLDRFDIGGSSYREKPRRSKDTNTWGLDTQIQKGPFELIAELAIRDAAEDRTGWYVQPSYRLSERWLAFYRFDRLEIDAGEETDENTLGVGFRPSDAIALKLEAYYSDRKLTEDFSGLAASIALAF